MIQTSLGVKRDSVSPPSARIYSSIPAGVVFVSPGLRFSRGCVLLFTSTSLAKHDRVNGCHQLEDFSYLVGDLLVEELPALRGTTQEEEIKRMQDGILKLYVKAQILWNALKEDNGQDLVE